MIDRRFVLVSLTSWILAGEAKARKPGSPDLACWPSGNSPTDIGTRVARKFVTAPHGNMGRAPTSGSIIYPEGCAWLGALTFAAHSRNPELSGLLAKRFEPLFTSEADLLPVADHVDPSMFGAVPLQLYIETGDPRYLAIGKAIADRQWAPPSAEWLTKLTGDDRTVMTEAVAAGLSPQTRFWIDDMYMITILQVQAFRATGQTVYLDRAALEMVAYLDRLQQPNGLFFHAPDVPFYWGRGNGWFAAGMAELLVALPSGHPHRARIMEGYRKMMATLLSTQGADGMWRQLIDRPESWPESSATGMFTFAMIAGVKSGWLKDPYAKAARNGWLGLCNSLDADANLHGVCEGTNKKNDYQYYMTRQRNVGDLHGQAPVLWCATALLA